MSRVNNRVRKVTHKNDVELPTSVAHTKKLDKKNDNALWIDAMSREIDNLKVAFGILKDGYKISVSHNKASGPLVFDARMTLERKAI